MTRDYWSDVLGMVCRDSHVAGISYLETVQDLQPWHGLCGQAITYSAMEQG